MAPGAARDGVEWTTERSDGETGEARIGRAPRWSRREVPDPPYVRVCVGQDCAKDGAADAWGLVRSLAPRGVGVGQTDVFQAGIGATNDTYPHSAHSG